MSNANRDYAIVYDIKNSSLVLSRPLIFYITDKNTSNIFVKLVTRITVGDGIDQYTDIENASNYILTMRVIKPNNEVKSIEATQHETESIFQFDLTENFKDIPGKYTCELIISTIVSSRQELITSDPFSYEVKRSILSNVGEIIETVDTTVEKLLNDLNTTKTDLSSQIKEIANYPYYTNLKEFDIISTDTVNYDETNKKFNLTDISSKLKSAIELGKKTIIFEKGNYLIDETIIIDNEITIIGNNSNIYINPKTASFSVFRIVTNNCTIKDLNFYSKNVQENVLPDSGATTLVSNVCCIDILGTPNDYIYDINVRNCSSENCSTLVSAMCCNNINIDDIETRENYFGIYTDNAHDIYINNSRIVTKEDTDIFGHCLYFGYNTKNVIVDNCILDMPGKGSNIVKCGSNGGASNDIIIKNSTINGVVAGTLFYLHDSSTMKFYNCNITGIGDSTSYVRLLQFNNNAKCEFIGCYFELDSFQKITQNISYVNNSILFKTCSFKILNSINRYCTFSLVGGSNTLMFVNCDIDYSNLTRGMNLIHSDVYNLDILNCNIKIHKDISFGFSSKDIVTYSNSSSPKIKFINTTIECSTVRDNSFIGFVKNDTYDADVILNNLLCINCNPSSKNIQLTDAEKDYKCYNNVLGI